MATFLDFVRIGILVPGGGTERRGTVGRGKLQRRTHPQPSRITSELTYGLPHGKTVGSLGRQLPSSLAPMQSLLTSRSLPLPPCAGPSSLLLPVVQSQVGGLELRAAVPSAVHVLDIEHKTLNFWEGQGANTDGPSGWRG